MADTKVFQTGPDFDMSALVQSIKQTYQAKGFTVSAMKIGNGISIKFSKNADGITKFIGMAQEVTANLTLTDGNTLYVNFTDAEWTGKIVGFIIGWFLCFIPIIFAVMGCIKQIELPKQISTDIQMLIGGGPTML
jgi:hypothetical protein